MSTSTGRQNSRFSTLNVFKFGGQSKPPPPPPKDPYYQSNPSLSSLAQSLAPDTPLTVSNTPIFARYAASARSPSPSPSYTPSLTQSLVPSSTLNQSTTSLSTQSTTSTRTKKFFQSLSIGKKQKASRAAPPGFSDEQPEAQFTDDPSISLPWNFQVRARWRPIGFA